MVILKNKYFLIIENIKDISLENIKKRFKFNIIYRNNKKIEDLHGLRIFRKECKSKDIKFFVANDHNLSSKLKADGIYLSAFNKDFKYLNYMKRNFIIIGAAHNIKEINLKIKQGCKYILLSRLFRVSYKPEMNYLGINRFNFYATNVCKKIVALGGINTSNINKLKIVNCDSFALMTEIKKKPAKIFSRLF
tara:strand:- start:7656 stop:8231 length:576 start_codon:yes stop_codon:yes gene_type:complete